MSLAFRRIKVYIRTALVVIVLAAVAVVLIKNRGNRVPVWFFGLIDEKQEINVVWLILCTAAGSIVSWWVIRAGVGLLRDMRELQRDSEFRRREQEQKELADKLREQERRIDEKINRGLHKADPPKE